MSSAGRSAAEDAVNHLRESIGSGKHWYLALLEAMGLWTAPEEVYEGRNYRYIIASEAFDWLLLAERLYKAVDGLIPRKAMERLLLQAQPPLELSDGEFRRLLGNSKYRALLNYWYGVVIEGALVAAVEGDIHKERLTAGLIRKRDVSEEAFRRVYGAPKKDLLKTFRDERGYSDSEALSVGELKEFTYWLFKYRLLKNDKARVASDTRRGIQQLQAMARERAMVPPYPDPDKVIDLTP